MLHCSNNIIQKYNVISVMCDTCYIFERFRKCLIFDVFLPLQDVWS